jgi:hypothetical protein
MFSKLKSIRKVLNIFLKSLRKHRLTIRKCPYCKPFSSPPMVQLNKLECLSKATLLTWFINICRDCECDAVRVGQFFSFSNPLELCSKHIPAGFAGQGGINKDCTIWLDGAKIPPKYTFKNNIRKD